MKQVLLITGSFISANFNVMLDVVRVIYDGDVMIHAIAERRLEFQNLPQYADVRYYPITNKHSERLMRLGKSKLFPHVSVFILRIMRYIDTFYSVRHQTRYEKQVLKNSERIIKDNEISQIITVCLPFTAHRNGLRLSSKYGLPWLPIYVDPYSNKTSKIFNSLWKRLSIDEEIRVIGEADNVYSLPEVFTNSPIPQMVNNIQFFEIPYIVNREVDSKNRDIVFAGGLDKKIRDPEPVFKLLLSVVNKIPSDIRFVFYVKEPAKYLDVQMASGNRIVFNKHVTRLELNKILEEALMLVNIGNNNSIQMPSKVVEYVSYRKPILFFYSDPNDASFRYFNYYPDICNIAVYEDLQDNIEKIVSFLQQEHYPITYASLMEVDVFKKSTPEFLKSVFSVGEE